MARPILMALAGASLALAAACSSSFTDANGWRYDTGTVRDWQTEFTASKGEIDGPGRLELHCALASFAIGRDRFPEDIGGHVPAAYRFDDGPWVGVPAIYTGSGARLDDGGEIDPIRPRLAGARRLAVALSPPGEEPFVMTFDLAGVDEALRRMREHRTCRAS